MVNKCTWAKLEVQKSQREFSHDKQQHMSTTNHKHINTSSASKSIWKHSMSDNLEHQGTHENWGSPAVWRPLPYVCTNDKKLPEHSVWPHQYLLWQPTERNWIWLWLACGPHALCFYSIQQHEQTQTCIWSTNSDTLRNNTSLTSSPFTFPPHDMHGQKPVCVQSEAAAGVKSGPRHSIACHAQHARDLKELARLGRWRQWRVLNVKHDESEKSKYKMSHVHRKRNTSTLQLCLQPSFTVWGNVNITECTSVLNAHMSSSVFAQRLQTCLDTPVCFVDQEKMSILYMKRAGCETTLP